MTTSNETLQQWVDEVAALTQPDSIHWCTGSEEEYQGLIDQMLESGDLVKLNDSYENCYLHRSDPTDVARVEHLTFICTPEQEDTGPNNHWMAPAEAHAKMNDLFSGCMQGRTMYVIPYCMGPIESPYSRCGVEITDSPYVVANMKLMTRMGSPALARIENEGKFVRGLHSIGELDPERRFIMHFPDELMIQSFGSGYGGNALLGKKCHALRIASAQAREEGWLAEHMLIVEIESPEGEKHYLAAAFPSQCGKTNLAMLIPPESQSGWKVRTIGDDIAWLHLDEEGQLRAINPESGYFGVVPGTNEKTNPNAYRHDPEGYDLHECRRDRRQRAVVGRQVQRRLRASTGRGILTTAITDRPLTRIHALRFRPTKNPAYSPLADDPAGVPISAIIFGGRRRTLAPARLSGQGLESRRARRRRRCLGDDGSRHRTGRCCHPSRPDGHETLLRLQLRRLLGSLAAVRRTRRQTAEDVPRQLVPPATKTVVSCGPDSVRTCACCAGSSNGAKTAWRPSKRRSATCRNRRISIRRVWTCSTTRPANAAGSGPGEPGRKEMSAVGDYLQEFGSRIPEKLTEEHQQDRRFPRQLIICERTSHKKGGHWPPFLLPVCVAQDISYRMASEVPGLAALPSPIVPLPDNSWLSRRT